MGNDRQRHGRVSSFALPLRTAVLLCLLFPLFCALTPRQAQAAYPLKEMTLAVAVTEGSQPAILYGLIQHFARQYAPFPVTLAYRSGRGGSYALSSLKGKSTTGYDLAALHFSSFMLLAFDRDRIFTPEDIAPVALFAYAPNALWVAEDSPFRTLDDLVVYARKPGNSLFIAGTGSYTDHHMADLLFNRAAGVKSQYLPLTGTAESVQAVKEKRAVACWGYALARSTMPGLRPIAVAAPERRPVLPDVATFREQNMDVVSGQYFGLAMPSEAKKESQEEVSAFFLDVFSNQELLKQAEAIGFAPEPLPLRDMAIFAGKLHLEAQIFLRDYSMFPKGAQR